MEADHGAAADRVTGAPRLFASPPCGGRVLSPTVEAMDSTLSAPAGLSVPRPVRSKGDRWMRRLLRIPDDARRCSVADAQSAFSRSVWISAARCLLTYLVLPILGPVVGLAGGVGPVLGLAVGTVSVVAIVVSMRRFFAADHRWRWRYTAIGAGILVLLFVQAVIDLADLAA